MDAKKLAAELAWLKKYPAFEERPASLTEFLGPDYLNIESKVRKRIRYELAEVMGQEVSGERITKYPLAMITGGIGIGKTTIASIVLPYLAHWVLCLKDPQDYFNLLPGSRIAFMQMSTSEDQAKEVVFGDIFARIKYSPWFSQKYPHDPKFKNQIRFAKDIWVLPGDSKDTTFEGYNILGGILDEADSHQVTKNKDYAESGYNTIHARITSRFQDRGFLLVIGQMKKSDGFAAKKFEEFKKDSTAYAVRMAIWDSLGMDSYEKDEDGNVKTFWYDTRRKQITPTGIAKQLADEEGSDHLLEIPEVYRKDFENNPEKALKDLAGIPPLVGDAFISLTNRIHDARDRWIASHDGLPSPVKPDGTFEPWFKAQDTLKRVAHIDLAYSGEGDALGFAMGHVREVVEIDGEYKPYITFDMLLRIKARPGGEIFIGNIRHMIYNLREELGFRIKKVTMDGFQSTDTMQQLRKRRIDTELVSVDRQILPYHDLREALYEDRLEFPPYLTYLDHTGQRQVEIAVKELSELIDDGDKVDHPQTGSKDVADAMAGVCFTLMGDRKYRRKVVNLQSVREERQQVAVGGGMFSHPALGEYGDLQAPIPPSVSDINRPRGV